MQPKEEVFGTLGYMRCYILIYFWSIFWAHRCWRHNSPTPNFET